MIHFFDKLALDEGGEGLVFDVEKERNVLNLAALNALHARVGEDSALYVQRPRQHNNQVSHHETSTIGWSGLANVDSPADLFKIRENTDCRTQSIADSSVQQSALQTMNSTGIFQLLTETHESRYVCTELSISLRPLWITYGHYDLAYPRTNTTG